MILYCFAPDSPVAGIDWRKSVGGGARAYLHAGPQLTPSQYDRVKQVIKDHGWQCTPSLCDGKPCLEVRGPLHKHSLEAALRDTGFIHGDRTLVLRDATKISIRDHFHDDLLGICGIQAVATDATYYAYAILRRKLELEKKGSFAFQVDKLRESIASKTYEPVQRTAAYKAIKSLVHGYDGTGNPLEDDKFIESLKAIYNSKPEDPFADFLTEARSKLADANHPLEKEKSQKQHRQLEPGGWFRYLKWLQKQRWEEIAAAIFYGTGSIFLMLFGRSDKSNYQTRAIASKLQDKMSNMGLDTPGGIIPGKTTAKKGLLQFMALHPAELSNGFTGLAGGFLVLSALKEDKPFNRVVEASLGLATLTGGMTAAFVKEKPKDPDEPEPKSLPEKIKRWIEERPNRVAAIGYGYSTAIHAYRAVSELRRVDVDYSAQKPLAYRTFGLRGAFVGMTLLWECLLSIASKNPGKSVDQGLENTAVSMVADAVLHQPVADREGAIVELSHHFLARPDVLGGKPEEMEAKLRAQIERTLGNPWADKPETPSAPQPGAPESALPDLTWLNTEAARSMARERAIRKTPDTGWIESAQASRRAGDTQTVGAGRQV